MGKKSSANRGLPSWMWLVPIYICLGVLFVQLIRNGHMQLLSPAGYIADIQSRLLWGMIGFAGFVGVVMITSFLVVAFRFNEGQSASYQPQWRAGKRLVLLGWGIPLLAMGALSVLVWVTAHQVDPYRPLSSTLPPITIQVVADRWKWLFIYPNEHIATVNYLQIPVNTPIALQLTADAPMNSFWVPRLSGQIFAMTGMVTQLHIEADKLGSYAGSSAEISGADFAGMDFTVNAVSAADYNIWKTTELAQTSKVLDFATYTQFAQPSGYNAPATYAVADPTLFRDIVMQYMPPGSDPSGLHIQGMQM